MSAYGKALRSEVLRRFMAGGITADQANTIFERLRLDAEDRAALAEAAAKGGLTSEQGHEAEGRDAGQTDEEAAARKVDDVLSAMSAAGPPTGPLRHPYQSRCILTPILDPRWTEEPPTPRQLETRQLVYDFNEATRRRVERDTRPPPPSRRLQQDDRERGEPDPTIETRNGKPVRRLIRLEE